MSVSTRGRVKVAAHRLAQVNISRPRTALDAPAMAGFVAAVDHVNRLADQSVGFVWRLRSSEPHGTTLPWDGSVPVIVNLSLWESYEALHAFVYRGPHALLVRQSSRWFEPIRQPSTALWWTTASEVPTLDEATRHLRFLQVHGPSPQAFTMRRRFEPDGRPTARSQRAGGR